jgi:hypothetical protein
MAITPFATEMTIFQQIKAGNILGVKDMKNG